MVLKLQYKKHHLGVERRKPMKISRDKVDICRARKKKSVADLAKAYGVSRARMNVILNQREVSVVSAGRLADALECDVTEIIED